jgi:hypothetical protein
MEEIAQTLMRTNEEALTKRSSDKEVAKVNGQSVSLSKVKRFQKRRQMPLIQKGPAPILPSAHNNNAPTACFERENYGLNYDWLGEEDDLSIPINAGLEFRNLFEDFAPLDDSAEAPNTSNSATLSQRPSRNMLNQSMDLDDSTDQPSKRKRSQSPISSEQEGRIFACPFYAPNAHCAQKLQRYCIHCYHIELHFHNAIRSRSTMSNRKHTNLEYYKPFDRCFTTL